MAKKKKPFTEELSPRIISLAERLAVKMAAKDRKQVIENSIMLLAYLHQAIGEGKEIAILDNKKVVKLINLTINDAS